MSRKRGCFFLLGLVTSVILILVVVKLLESPRDKYRTIDFENDIWMADFVKDYQQAVIDDDEWIKNAEIVGLRVAGYLNVDKVPPEKVHLETNREGNVVVTILSRTLMDDSIRRQETRVELIKEKEIWRVVWAGIRLRCYRGSSGFGWTPSLCP